MKKEQFSRFVTINPYNNTFFLYENETLKRFTPKFSSKNYYISFLETKDFIFTTLEISRNIPYEDLADMIELRVYEELDLDQTIEYLIRYYEVPSPAHKKDRTFQIFVTEPALLEEIFGQTTRQIPYIDAIVPAPLLFRPLYDQEILQKDEIHLFIYFQKDDAFLALYNEGYLLYTKSMKYSFRDIAQRLSELKGEEVSVEEVMQNLAKDGLKLEDLDELQYYMQVFSEIFMHINDILIYAKRANNIEVIDKVFISSEVGFIKGIEEYAQTYLAQEAYDFLFDYGIKTQDPYVEDLHFLMALTAKNIVLDKIEYPNLTIFQRPPPFLHRPSGKLFVALLASVLLSSLYPLYNIFLAYKFKYDTAILKKEYPKIHAKRVALETQINRLKAEEKKIQKLIANKRKELEKREKILQAIYDKKVNYIMKAATIADLSQDLVKHKIKTTQIDNHQKRFDFNVTATDEKRITKFIKYIYDNKSRKYDVSTKEINKTDPNSSVYYSIIEVEHK